MTAKQPSGTSLRSLERLFEQRFDNLDERFDEQKDNTDKRFNGLKDSLDKIDRDLRSGYATKDEVKALHEQVNDKVSHESIWWMKMVVGGMAGLILLGFGAAVVKLVFGG